MIKTISIALPPAEAANPHAIKRALAGEADVQAKRITGYHITKSLLTPVAGRLRSSCRHRYSLMNKLSHCLRSTQS